MRRLPGILLATGATLIVIVALLISGLRLMLPKLNDYRPQLLAQVEKLSGVPVQMDFLQGSWETFGPQLEVRNLSVTLPKSDVHIERVTLALDVWQSLLHWRWQFRDLTFYQFRLDLNATLGGDREGDGLEPGKISDLMLRQLDHFDLRDSRISFLTPAGARADRHDVRCQLVVTDVTFRSLSQQDIRDYIATGEPMDKAGAYGIQGKGGCFVRTITGSYHAVVGLPLVETHELLSNFVALRDVRTG